MSRRFKPNQKRFALDFSSGFRLLQGSDKEKLQNDMSEISNQLTQLRQDNWVLDEAIKTISGIILLVGTTSVLKPYLDKLKSWLVSTNLYIKKLEQIKQIIDSNKNLSKIANKNLQPILKNTGSLKTEIPKFSLAFKALNAAFILSSLKDIKNNLDKIKELQSSKVDTKDTFESKEQQIASLNSRTQFEVIRLANSVASFIPGAFAVTTLIDTALLIFNPDNLENLGFVLSGFKGGKEEAKKVWENAAMLSSSTEVIDLVSFNKANSATLDKVRDPKIKQILHTTITYLYLGIDSENQISGRANNKVSDVFNKFDDAVRRVPSVDYKSYVNWSNKPGNAEIIGELIAIFKTFKNAIRKAKKQELVKKMKELIKKFESTKDINLRKKYTAEFSALNKEYEQ
jgi:hypothetical protein